MFPKNIHYVFSPSFHKSKYILILLKRRQTSSESKAVTPEKEQSLTFHQQIHNSFSFPSSILCYGLAKTYNGVTASASDPSESFENRTKKKRLRYSRKELEPRKNSASLESFKEQVSNCVCLGCEGCGVSSIV